MPMLISMGTIIKRGRLTGTEQTEGGRSLKL